MAIGDGNFTNSNNSNKIYEPTYYSRFRLSRNNDMGISISYRSGLMIVEINKAEDGFKTTPLETIYLSPLKAKMLAEELRKFVEYKSGNKIDPKKAFGVNAGMNEKVTFIGFSSDSSKNVYCTIGKFDGSGVIVESAKYTFAREYNYSLEWNDIEANDLQKIYNDEVELNLLIQAFDDFSRSATGALGYGTLDLNRYEMNKIDKRIDQVFDKLGIERRSYNGGGNRGSNNFLTNASSKPTTLEDVEDLLG